MHENTKAKAPEGGSVSVADVGVTTAVLGRGEAWPITVETLYVNGGYRINDEVILSDVRRSSGDPGQRRRP